MVVYLGPINVSRTSAILQSRAKMVFSGVLWAQAQVVSLTNLHTKQMNNIIFSMRTRVHTIVSNSDQITSPLSSANCLQLGMYISSYFLSLICVFTTLYNIITVYEFGCMCTHYSHSSQSIPGMTFSCRT